MSHAKANRLYFREPFSLKKGKVIFPHRSKIEGNLNEIRFKLEAGKKVQRDLCSRAVGYGAPGLTTCCIQETITDYGGYVWVVQSGGGKDKLTTMFLDELQHMVEANLIEQVDKLELFTA